MKIEQLEHIIRAAAVIVDDDELIIIGSQAILGAYPHAPEVCSFRPKPMYIRKTFPTGPTSSTAASASYPHFMRHSVITRRMSPDTAVLPEGWQERLLAIKTPGTRGATGWCLHPHDLALAKLAAGREKGLKFVAEMARHWMLKRSELELLAATLQVPVELTELVRARVRALVDG